MAVVEDEWARMKGIWDGVQTGWQSLLANPEVTLGSKISFWWESSLAIVGPLVGPLGLGCFVVASVAGILSYYVSLFFIRSYRLKRWGQLMPPNLTPADIDDTEEPTKKSETAA